MKKLFFLTLLTSIISCQDKLDGYVINGITKDFQDNTWVYLSEIQFSEGNFEFDGDVIDSTLVFNNRFQFDGKIDGDFCQMAIHTIDYKVKSKNIWITNDQITYDASNSSFYEAKVLGSPIHDQYYNFYEVTHPFDIKLDSIETLAEGVSEEDSIAIIYFEQYENIEIDQREAAIRLIKEHPEYEISSYYLLFLQHYIAEETTKELYEGLSERVKTNIYSRVVFDHIQNSLKLEIGQKAPDIILPNKDGIPISLADFKGKYVLIDFWSSNCGPCRLENRNLFKTYGLYKERGFEIFSVSLDTDKLKWESAMEKDSMIWTSVSDHTGRYGKYPVIYDISSIPTNYLIDKNGVIIDKYIRGNDLLEKLQILFGG